MADTNLKKIVINDRVVNFDELVHVTPPIQKHFPLWGESKPSIGVLYCSNPGKFDWFSFHDQETANQMYEEIIVQWNQRKIK